MARRSKGTVMDDDLFKDYHKIRNGETVDLAVVKKLFHYYNNDLVFNIAQAERCGIEIPANEKQQMARNGLKRQSLEELALLNSTNRVILSRTRNDFPYVNIMNQSKLENNYSATFDMAEVRDFGKTHIKAILSHAKKILIYDNYLSDKSTLERLLKEILPQKNLEIEYNAMPAKLLESLKKHCGMWTFSERKDLRGYHDRYMIVDGEVEIIMTSGLDHLGETTTDFTYILRPIDEVRFNRYRKKA